MGKHRPATKLDTNIFKCKYCQNVALYLTVGGKYICDKSPNKCPVNKTKNKIGLSNSYLTGNRNGGSYNYALLPEATKEKMKWNKGLTKETHPSLKKQGETYSQNLKTGKTSYKLRGFAVDRSKAWRKTTILKDSFGKISELESNLEVQVANHLNTLNVKWIRCINHLTLKSTKERYTPDFYLPDYDIYLDPKGNTHKTNNRYKFILKQKLKINRLIIEQNYKIFILYPDNKGIINISQIQQILP